MDIDSLIEHKEESLMVRLSNNDLEAWSDLVHQYSNLVYSISFQILKNNSDAEDAAQNTFVRLKYYASKYDSTLPVIPWLAKIASCEAIKIYNKKKYEKKKEQMVIDTKNSIRQPQSESIMDEALHKERSEIINRAIEILPERHRVVLNLYYGGGLSQAEIAKELGVSQVSISDKIKNGLERLKAHLKKTGFFVSDILLTTLLKESMISLNAPSKFVHSLSSQLPQNSPSEIVGNFPLEESPTKSFNLTYITTAKYFLGILSIGLIGYFSFSSIKDEKTLPNYITNTTSSNETIKIFKPVDGTNYIPFYYGRGKVPKDIDRPGAFVDGLVQFRGADKKWRFEKSSNGVSAFFREDRYRIDDTNGFYLDKHFNSPVIFKGIVNSESLQNGKFGFVLCSAKATGEKTKLSNEVQNLNYIDIVEVDIKPSSVVQFKLYIWKHEKKWISGIFLTSKDEKVKSYHTRALTHHDLPFELGFFSNCLLRCEMFEFCDLPANWEPFTESDFKNVLINEN